jgi:hypothetical protein
MAHYAFLDENNIVTEVIVGKEEGNFNWEQQYGSFRGQLCKRTSYNTHGGIHNNDGTPFRKNYAGIGYTYDEDRDAFIPPKPFNSWILNEDTCLWKSPIPYPITNTQNKINEFGNPQNDLYRWNEQTLSWDIVEV